MKYCSHCGKQILDEAIICPGCGCAVSGGTYQRARAPEDLLAVLSERVKINGIIWLVIAVLQILSGLCGLWFVLIVGVLNIVGAIKDMKYSEALKVNPVGIVANYEPLTRPIITAVYNLLVGGVIGVAGSVYYFLAIRNFVMERKTEFLVLENAYQGG